MMALDRDAQRRANRVAVALFVLTASFILAKTGRDALYFQADGIRSLPWAYLATAAMSMPTAFAALTAMHCCGVRRTRVLAPVAMASVLALASVLSQPGGGPAMTALFTSIPVVFGVLFSLSWLLGAELLGGYDNQTRARAYGRIGATSILGGVVGGALARTLSASVDPRSLLALAAVGLVGVSLMLAAAHRRYPALAPAPAMGPAPRPARAVFEALKQPYAARLLAVAIAAAFAAIVLEFQLFLSVAVAGGDSQQNMAFFATIYTLLNVAALIVQLALLPRLQRAVGVNGSLMILPWALFGGALFLAGTVSLATRMFLRVTEGGLKASIHRVSWEQAYLPLDEKTRAQAKLVVDGVGPRLAEGAAALGFLAWLWLVVGQDPIGDHGFLWMNAILVAVAGVWLALSRILSRSYQEQAMDPTAVTIAEVRLPDT